MNHRPAPYEHIIRITTLLLFAGWLAAYFYPGVMAGWGLTVLIALAVVVLAMVGLEVYQVIQRVRAGQLYFLRTISFYLNFALIAFIIGSFIADIFFGAGGEGSWQSTFIILALLLGYWSQSFPYVYLDSVRITHRMGTATTTVPLFNIADVQEDKDGLVVIAENGTKIGLFASSLPSAQFEDLRARLLAL